MYSRLQIIDYHILITTFYDPPDWRLIMMKDPCIRMNLDSITIKTSSEELRATITRMNYFIRKVNWAVFSVKLFTLNGTTSIITMRTVSVTN